MAGRLIKAKDLKLGDFLITDGTRRRPVTELYAYQGKVYAVIAGKGTHNFNPHDTVRVYDNLYSSDDK
jgi:hypothetical protein